MQRALGGLARFLRRAPLLRFSPVILSARRRVVSQVTAPRVYSSSDLCLPNDHRKHEHHACWMAGTPGPLQPARTVPDKGCRQRSARRRSHGVRAAIENRGRQAAKEPLRLVQHPQGSLRLWWPCLTCGWYGMRRLHQTPPDPARPRDWIRLESATTPFSMTSCTGVMSVPCPFPNAAHSINSS
ncbi:hypothetical protein IWX90DRAFT_218445 [Phyllosticta citrichinensis]|uniref:Uncharacterized protein n=1 Tax=Phyllosticta citrichinensis TaxID=1130410 RepID=A0ABR1XTL8_9PEZI